MTDALAQYACDACQTRKVSCTRQQGGCERCKTNDLDCVYSRSGVIRRIKKRKIENPEPSGSPEFSKITSRDQDEPARKRPAVDSSQTTHERMQMLARTGRGHPSLKALTSLFEEYQAIWQDSEDTGLESLRRRAEPNAFYNELEVTSTQMNGFLDQFLNGLVTEHLPVKKLPREVLAQLSALHERSPRDVQDKGWALMFYTIQLQLSQKPWPGGSLEKKWIIGFWEIFNDAHFLLRPSVTTIQALILMVTRLGDTFLPSTCWMLISKACAMLQALGISHPRLSSATQEQRALLFWRLNVLDKTLALLLHRPPLLRTEPDLDIPRPDQLLKIAPQNPSNPFPALFGAHFTRQMFCLSQIMAEVWEFVYGRADASSSNLLTVRTRVEAWFEEASKLLAATALAEKSFIPKEHQYAVDAGLQNIKFQYAFLMVLLSRPCAGISKQSLEPCHQLLRRLKNTGLNLKDGGPPTSSFGIPCWQLLHAPFTAFFTLFGGIISQSQRENGTSTTAEALTAMRKLPAFLGRLRGPQHREGLLRVANHFIHHLEAILSATDNTAGPKERTTAAGPAKSAKPPMPTDPELQLDEIFAAWLNDDFFNKLMYGT